MSTFCWQQPASTFSFSFPQPQWFLNSSNCEDQHLRGNQHNVVDQHRRDQRANHQNASKVVFDNNRIDNTSHQALIGCQRNMPGTTGIPRRDLQQRHGNVVALHHNRTPRSHEGCGNRTDQGDQWVNTHAEFWQGDPQQEPNTGCNNSLLPLHWGPLHDQQWTDDAVLVHSEQGPTASAAGQQEHQLGSTGHIWCPNYRWKLYQQSSSQQMNLPQLNIGFWNPTMTRASCPGLQQLCHGATDTYGHTTMSSQQASWWMTTAITGKPCWSTQGQHVSISCHNKNVSAFGRSSQMRPTISHYANFSWQEQRRLNVFVATLRWLNGWTTHSPGRSMPCDSTSTTTRCPTMRTTWCNRASESATNKGWSSDHPDATRHQNNRADECNKTYLNWELNREVNSTINSSWIQQWFSVQQTYTISIDNVFDQHFTL